MSDAWSIVEAIHAELVEESTRSLKAMRADLQAAAQDLPEHHKALVLHAAAHGRRASLLAALEEVLEVRAAEKPSKRHRKIDLRAMSALQQRNWVKRVRGGQVASQKRAFAKLGLKWDAEDIRAGKLKKLRDALKEKSK